MDAHSHNRILLRQVNTDLFCIRRKLDALTIPQREDLRELWRAFKNEIIHQLDSLDWVYQLDRHPETETEEVE